MSAYKWAILLLVTVLLLASACTVAGGQSMQGGVVKISSPPKNGKAGPTERVIGKAQLSEGYSLWIVPRDPTEGKYYPHPRSRCGVMRLGHLVFRRRHIRRQQNVPDLRGRR